METETSVRLGHVEGQALDLQRFEELYQQALAAVYGYFLHRCGGRVSVAEDLTQETFMAAISELRSGTRVERPLPWLYGIARHKLLDHYRRQKRESQRSSAGADETAPGLPSDDGGESSRLRAIDALARVPQAQRIALVLRHMDGLSVPEVAQELGRSVEAVESLLSRGREQFRRAFKEATL